MLNRLLCAFGKHNWVKSWRTKYDESIVVRKVECTQCKEVITIQ